MTGRKEQDLDESWYEVYLWFLGILWMLIRSICTAVLIILAFQFVFWFIAPEHAFLASTQVDRTYFLLGAGFALCSYFR